MLQGGWRNACDTVTSRMNGTFNICHQVEGDNAAPGTAML
jgi:hypothetical protein